VRGGAALSRRTGRRADYPGRALLLRDRDEELQGPQVTVHGVFARDARPV